MRSMKGFRKVNIPKGPKPMAKIPTPKMPKLPSLKKYAKYTKGRLG